MFRSSLCDVVLTITHWGFFINFVASETSGIKPVIHPLKFNQPLVCVESWSSWSLELLLEPKIKGAISDNGIMVKFLLLVVSLVER